LTLFHSYLSLYLYLFLSLYLYLFLSLSLSFSFSLSASVGLAFLSHKFFEVSLYLFFSRPSSCFISLDIFLVARFCDSVEAASSEAERGSKIVKDVESRLIQQETGGTSTLRRPEMRQEELGDEGAGVR
jgi:hypothetical protein